MTAKCLSILLIIKIINYKINHATYTTIASRNLDVVGIMKIYVCILIAILKPRGLRQSGSSLHLGGGQSGESELEVIESYLVSETMNHGNIDNS